MTASDGWEDYGWTYILSWLQVADASAGLPVVGSYVFESQERAPRL